MYVVVCIDTADKETAAKEICECIETATARARREIAARKVPHLYSAGLRYIRQSPRACVILPPVEVMKRGGGDCKQLVLWRIAELREAGEHATPRILWLTRKRNLQAHAQVRREDGSIEDPSAILGMKV